MGVWYCNREDVKSSLDIPITAGRNGQIDREIEASSRLIEGRMHRVFYPTIATRYFDRPPANSAKPWRLWLDEDDELVSVLTVTAGGVEIPGSDYFLGPANDGPPWLYIELDQDGDTPSWDTNGTGSQRDIVITGTFGWREDSEAAGALAAAVGTTTTATITVSDSAAIGVGQLIKIGSERMIVTGKSLVDTTQNLSGTLASDSAAKTVLVGSGAAFTAGETILLDAERMLIEDIAGNNLIVKRAVDGSALAAHTASDVYAARSLTVQRGVLGTTAATHSSADAITRHVVPGPVRAWCIAETLNSLLQQSAGYSRVVGSGEGQREASGKGLDDLREEAFLACGRFV